MAYESFWDLIFRYKEIKILLYGLWAISNEFKIDGKMFLAGLVAVLLAFGYWFLFMRNKLASGSGKNLSYAQTNDPNAQKEYDAKHGKDVPKLTAKQMLELSWKFLYDITEIVMYKFSARARRDVHQCGKTLAENGMRYNHEVAKSPLAYGIKFSKKVVETKGKSTQSKGK